jgi:hypothetical protein
VSDSEHSQKPGQPPLDVTRQIDALCDEFAAFLNEAEAPALSPFLGRIDAAHRSFLLEELVALALEHLNRLGWPEPEEKLLAANVDIAEEIEPHLKSTVSALNASVETISLHGPHEKKLNHSPIIREAGQGEQIDCTLSYVVRDAQNLVCSAQDGAVDGLLSTFAAGTVIADRFRLIGELGRGGMGVVHLAQDMRLERKVAVKAILTDFRKCGVHDAHRMQNLFLQEARIGAALLHPGIAAVFDYGIHHGHPYTVMEYLSGESLRELLRSDYR